MKTDHAWVCDDGSRAQGRREGEKVNELIADRRNYERVKQMGAGS